MNATEGAVDDVTVPTSDRPVILRDGDDASGMATMIAELLTDNLRDFPARARVAARTRGALVLHADDRDVAITLSFEPDRIEIADGGLPGAPTMAGSWLAMSAVCSGRTAPLRAVVRRDIRIRRGRAMWTVPMAGFVLSVPASFYDDDVATRRRRICVGISAVALVVAVATYRYRHGRTVDRSR